MWFQVGDTVRTLMHLNGPSGVAEGSEGVVTEITNDPYWPYRVQFDGGAVGIYSENELELVSEVASREDLTDQEDSEQVSHPSHYTWLKGFEVIDFSEQFNFNLGNVIKYVARSGRKTEDPIRDLEKARWYLTREIERIQKESN